MNFSERIKQLCKERGLMMKDLAAKLEITPTGLSKAIGQPYPQLQTLERIAGALGVSVSELFAPAPSQISISRIVLLTIKSVFADNKGFFVFFCKDNPLNIFFSV